MTRSSAAGAPRSKHAASTGIRCARRTATSSRPAVAVADGCRPDPLGRPALGVAVLDGAGTVRALEQRPWATPQEADRLGAPSDPAGQALAGEAPRDHCRRLQLRRTRPDRGGAAACLPGHPVATRCQPVRAGAGAATGAARPAASQRRPLAEAYRGAGRSRDRLVVDHAAGVVRRPAADARDHFRDGGVVSQRPAARADPLGAGAGSRREAGTAGIPGDRHRNHSGGNPRLVRLALARGNDVPGRPRPSRRRDPAPMLAIARTTPALLGLFSLVTIWMHGLIETRAAAIRPRTAGWYGKPELTFSDAIATVRRVLWCPPDLWMSRHDAETIKIPAGLLRRFTETLCYAA